VAEAANYDFAIPNTGPFLRLLADSRKRLLSILESTGSHRSLPFDRLLERWDVSGSGGESSVGSGLNIHGKSVSAGRTTVWRKFSGLRLEWVLADCVGCGLVECFRTGSVGMGIRML